MSRPRLESVWFGEGQYPRLARVLEHTAREHCTGWDISVRQVPKPTVRAASGSQSHADNGYKLGLWRDTVLGAPEGSRMVLVDADTFVTGPLDSLWDIPFDFAYTARDASKYPLNAGVVAVRANDASRKFFQAWAEKDASFMGDAAAHRVWRQLFGGMNQASLGAVLAELNPGVTIAKLSCLTWNAEDTAWSRFDPASTRIVHVKSALRMMMFGIHHNPKLAPLVKLWKDAERAANSTPLLSNCVTGNRGEIGCNGQ